MQMCERNFLQNFWTPKLHKNSFVLMFRKQVQLLYRHFEKQIWILMFPVLKSTVLWTLKKGRHVFPGEQQLIQVHTKSYGYALSITQKFWWSWRVWLASWLCGSAQKFWAIQNVHWWHCCVLGSHVVTAWPVLCHWWCSVWMHFPTFLLTQISA